MNLTIILVVCSVGMLILALGGVAVKWILKEISDEASNRADSAKIISKKQDDAKLDLKTVTDGHEKRIDRLEVKSTDYRSGKAVDDSILHSKNNLITIINSVDLKAQRTADMVDLLKDRVTRQETKQEQTAIIVSEIKSELKETRHEINERFDSAAKQQQTQFDQLCSSIREISKREAR